MNEATQGDVMYQIIDTRKGKVVESGIFDEDEAIDLANSKYNNPLMRAHINRGRDPDTFTPPFLVKESV